MLRKLSILSILAITSLITFAQDTIPMDKNVRYGKLSNGLTYYIRYNKLPEQRADFYIAQNVGAILEEDHQNGLAHFLEHMAFNGTKNLPEKTLINYLESTGSQFGRNLNAYTSLDETVYMLRSIPTTRQSIVDSCILILHDWSSFISLEEKEIDKERGVILEEWRTGANANRRMWKEGNKLKYPGSQYAKRDVIGDTAVINNFTYDALRSYYKKWYRPDLQAIIIVGDIDLDKVEQSIKSQFSDIPFPEAAAKRVIYQVPENKEPIISIVTDVEAKVALLGLEYKHTPIADSDKLKVSTYTAHLEHALISSMLGERFDDLAKKPSANFIQAQAEYSSLNRSTDAFQVVFVAKEGKEKEAFNDMLTEVERMKRYGFTEAELSRAKEKISSHIEKAYNERDKVKSTDYVQEYVGHFLELEAIPGVEWEYKQVKIDFEKNIKLEGINKRAAAYIRDENLIVDIAAPKKDDVKLPSKEEILSALSAVKSAKIEAISEKKLASNLLKKEPKAGTIATIEKGTLFGETRWTLSNGIKVIIKTTDFKDDEILMSAFSNGGLSTKKEIEDLISARFASMIINSSGLASFSEADLEKMLAGKNVSVSPSIGEYTENIKASSSVKDFETMLQLNYLYFTAPRKSKDDFKTNMEMLRTALANSSKDPRTAFKDSISMITSGYHPRTILMQPSIIEKIDLNQAFEFYKERFANPADFTFVFIGNIQADSAKTLILKYLGGLKTTATKENWQDNGVRIPSGKVRKSFEKELTVEKTSTYLLVSGGMPYNLINEVQLSALADILDIRYTESIREKEGGTYGVRVRADLSDKPQEQAELTISFDTDQKKKDRLMQLVYNELDSICLNGPLLEDVIKVKENLLKQHKEDIKENRWWLSAISIYEQDGIIYPNKYEEAVKSISVESIKQTLNALYKQNNSIEIIMNPKTK